MPVRLGRLSARLMKSSQRAGHGFPGGASFCELRQSHQSRQRSAALQPKPMRGTTMTTIATIAPTIENGATVFIPLN
ncbi:hypothetical protein LPU83_pLPU83c_0322 (plasmid) [Rhizobium favelukesii]|uniref:Uncharacterized protein n=1 Tax=Rhizobium favelukesii TaxID=348824 RepID=W6RJ48_9HYPH|nr:hypothetical protein LPU83_pLPU83c_0322 [Rhizobium favelukesii]